jgi:hypothetical protein
MHPRRHSVAGCFFKHLEPNYIRGSNYDRLHEQLCLLELVSCLICRLPRSRGIGLSIGIGIGKIGSSPSRCPFERGGLPFKFHHF